MPDNREHQTTRVHDGVLWVSCPDGWRVATPIEAGAEIERLRAALRRIDELRSSSGLTDAEMLFAMRSFAKEALS